MPGVFISYRRQDSAGHAGRLFDRLLARFGPDRVFMDVAGIEAGTDFVEAIEQAVGSCDVLLAVIGKEWLDSRHKDGSRRLDDPHDFVRLEIGAALKRKVRVVPLLVEGGAMPSAEDLPEELKSLARRQAVELRDNRWDADVQDLASTLSKIVPVTHEASRVPSPIQSWPRRILLTLRRYIAVWIVSVIVLVVAALLTHQKITFYLGDPADDGGSPLMEQRARLAVFLQIVDNRDRGLANRIGDALKAQGYKVEGAELAEHAKTAGDIRFVAGDAASARDLKASVERALATAGYELDLKLQELSPAKFPDARPGRLEVWLPPLSKGP